MPYGQIKVDEITFTNAGVDQTISVSGVVASISGNITATGTISGNVIRGGTLVSGATVTGTAGQFGTLTGNTAGFTTVTGTTVTGTTANFVSGVFTTQISGTTVTGNVGQFTTVTGGTAGFTTVTGTTVTGATANFTSGNFTAISGATVTFTSGVFASGTAAAPSVSVGAIDNGIYSPGADQVAISTNGTQRLTVDTAATTSTLPVVHPLGAAGTPSLTFTGDLNTGFWSPTADTLAASTGGTERLRITSAGNVGVGTTSPAYPLSIFNATNNFLQFSKSGDAVAGSLVGRPNGVAELRIQNSENEPIAFLTNNIERARIDSSGRLLVGTSSTASTGDSQFAYLQVRANTAGSTAAGLISLQRGEAATSITTGERLGSLLFADNAGNEFAAVTCEADAAASSGDYPGRLVFSTTADGASSPTERMRIGNGGRSSFYSDLDVINSRTNAAAGTTIALFWGAYGASSTTTGGTDSVYIWSNGNIQNTNNSYTGISDIKLKENIVDANSQWDDLKALQVRNYNFKEGQTHTQIGLVAQEVELISPGLVSESPDRDEEGNDLGTVTKSVNYSVLYMKAVKALQEAMERIETLEAEMAAVKAQLA